MYVQCTYAKPLLKSFTETFYSMEFRTDSLASLTAPPPFEHIHVHTYSVVTGNYMYMY
jgi:hypothetical protein